MKMTALSALAAVALVALACGVQPVRAAGPAASVDPAAKARLVIQVSDADPKKWALALNNAKNVQTDLGRQNVEIEIVAYGPGLGMLKFDSEVGGRIAEAIGEGVQVIACENTMTNNKLTRDDMLPKIGYAKAGVVEIMNRQREGWAYIRP